MILVSLLFTYQIPQRNNQIVDLLIEKTGSAHGSTYSQALLRFIILTTKDTLTKGVIALEKTLGALS